LAAKGVAENIGEQTPMLWCLAGIVLPLCTWTYAGMQVAKARGWEESCVQACVCSWFTLCTGYPCIVYNESKIVAREASAPPKTEMVREE